MSRPVLQFTRLTSSGRLPDRFLACQVRDLIDTEEHARLFVLIEIIRPWLSASQIGQALIQAFVTGYQEANSSDGLKQTEAGLKRINETLVHLTQQGETEWVGHLHALFALEMNGTVHVAQTGRAGAVLVRDDSVSRVTELEGAQSAASASRTFGTITSGELMAGDALVIGSGDLFRALGNDTIADSLRDASAAETVQRFVRILRQHQSRTAAALVVRAYDPVILADQPLLAEPEVIYLDEPPIETLGGSLRSVGRRLGRFALLGSQRLARVSRSLSDSFKTTVLPRGRSIAADGQKRAAEAIAELRTKHLPNAIAAARPLLKRAREATQAAASASAEQLKQFGRTTSRAVNHAAIQRAEPPQSEALDQTRAQSEDRGLIGKTLYTIRHYTEAPAATNRRALTLPSIHVPKLAWPPRISWLSALIKPKNRPRLYAGVAAILFVILVANLSLLQRHRQQSQQSANATASVTALRARFDDVKLTIALKHDASVASDLSTILDSVAPLTKTSAAASALALQQEVQDTFDGLTNATRIRNPKLIATFDQPAGLARLGSSLVTIPRSSGKLLTSPIAGQLIDDRSTLPAGERGATLTRFDQSDAVAILSNKPLAYQLKTPGDTPTALGLNSGTWETATAMASFGNNLYLLDPAGNQIWKHVAGSDGKYDAGTKFITDGTSVTNAVSLAIDGSVYAVASNGTITKLTRGQRDSFTVKDLPKDVALSDARSIWTNADVSSLFILTKTALFQLSKTGSYSRRYIADQFTDLTAFVVDPAAKQAWVLNSDKVYELNLTGA